MRFEAQTGIMEDPGPIPFPIFPANIDLRIFQEILAKHLIARCKLVNGGGADQFVSFKVYVDKYLSEAVLKKKGGFMLEEHLIQLGEGQNYLADIFCSNIFFKTTMIE